MTRIRYALVILLTALCALCAYPLQAETHSSREILRSASELPYPPFAVVTEDGEADGFSVELLKAVGRVMGLDIHFKVAPWNEIKEELSEGKLDVLPLVSYSRERDSYFDFSAPYLRMHGTIFVRKEDRDKVHSEDDLDGLEVLVMKGDTAQEYATRKRLTDKLILTDSFEEAMRRLAAGEHDAVLVQQVVGWELIHKLGLKNVVDVGEFEDMSLKPQGSPLKGFEQKFCFAVPEGRHELIATLNEGLAIVISNGEYDRLYHKWFGPILPPRPVRFLDILKMAVLLLLPMLFILGAIWLIFLRMEVRRKTGHLNREIAERAQAEERLAKTKNYLNNIIDSMPSMLIGLDENGRVTRWNSEAERRSGISREKALGCNLEHVIPRISIKMMRIREALSGGAPYTTVLKTRHQSGEIQHEDITVYPLLTEKGKGAVVLIENISERVHMEQVLVQSEKMMSVGGLAAGMAHEINNPLAGILGHTQNIRNRIFGNLKKNRNVAEECGVDLEKVREYLNRREIPRMLNGIHESGTRAAAIVSNMLSFSRKSERKHDNYNLAELLDRTIELAASDYNLDKYYDFRKITIIRDYDEDMPEVYCDGGEIQQVLLNLLKNGAEAMSEKEYTDDCPCFICRVKKCGTSAIVEIQDNGPGMDDQIRTRVFEPFFTTKEVGRGTGLGLSVSYFIITDQHNGSLEVDSEPGKWTRFTICLPLDGHSCSSAPRCWY